MSIFLKAIKVGHMNMLNSLRTPHAVLIAVMLASVSGCGGGGGSGGGTGGSSAAPTATSSAVVTNEDTPGQGSLNASDPENNPLIYSIVSNGSRGMATITNTATGAFTYSPSLDANGTDSFSFKANDGSSDSNNATVTVTIVAVNDAPVAQNGTLTTNEDASGTGTLVATDAELQPLTYSIVNSGSRGTATITNATTGAFIYSPNPNTNGTDSITFRANDSALDSNVATVTITINPVNDTPVAFDGSLTTNEDTLGSGTLIVVDTDVQPLTYSIVSNGSQGNAAISDPSTGAYVYIPDPNANGTDSFTFRANDGLANSNVATVTITINPVNDAPVAQTGALTTNEDTPGAGTLVAIDAELQPLTYSIVNNGSQGTATLTDSSTGAYVYVPDPNTNGTDSFTFLANDGLLNSGTATVTVTITPVNDVPVATGSCSNIRQKAAQPLAGTLNATDLESPALLMFDLNADGSGGAGPIVTSQGGTVTITDQTTGAYTYQPDTAAGDKRGIDTFGFQVTDPDSGTANATETVIVDQTIMPLGDSITLGTLTITTPTAAKSVGYRKPLYDTLIAAGFSFDFVGTANEGSGVLNFDFDNEGHGGWTASEIAWGKIGFPTDGVRAWLDANPSDIVLLHAGTNGLTANTDIDVGVILDEIDTWEASANGNPVTVVLALIIDWNPINPDAATLNSNLLTMAGNRIAAGDKIIVVNQHDALIYPNDMGDTWHPITAGYAKMSNVWFTALTSLVDKCP